MKAWKPTLIALALALAASGCTTIVRSSVPSGGGAANGPSEVGARLISDNGRYVAFGSTALNLVPNDTNAFEDAFRHDNQTGATVRVSVDNAGGEITTSPGLKTIPVAISGDGEHVAFRTDAALEPGDTNGTSDIYVRSVTAATTDRVSIRPDGSPILSGAIPGTEYFNGVTISDDGRYVLVVDGHPGGGTAYLRDRQTDTTKVVAELAAGALLTGDATHMIENHLCTGGPCPFRSTVVSLADGSREEIDTQCGFQAYDVSADSRFVVGLRFGAYPTFTCPAPSGLVRWDRTTRQFKAIPAQFIDDDRMVSISNSGRFVAVVGDPYGVAIYDLATGVKQNAAADGIGRPAGSTTYAGALSGSGRYVVFSTQADLIPDGNGSVINVYTRYAVQPGVTGAAPNALARGAQHQVVTITGTELLLPASVAISGAGVTVHSVSLPNTTTLKVDVSVDPGAPVGARDITVSNGGGFGHSDAVCAGCLTIS